MKEDINKPKRSQQINGIDKIIDYSKVSNVDYVNAELPFIHQQTRKLHTKCNRMRSSLFTVQVEQLNPHHFCVTTDDITSSKYFHI